MVEQGCWYRASQNLGAHVSNRWTDFLLNSIRSCHFLLFSVGVAESAFMFACSVRSQAAPWPWEVWEGVLQVIWQKGMLKFWGNYREKVNVYNMINKHSFNVECKNCKGWKGKMEMAVKHVWRSETLMYHKLKFNQKGVYLTHLLWCSWYSAADSCISSRILFRLHWLFRV